MDRSRPRGKIGMRRRSARLLLSLAVLILLCGSIRAGGKVVYVHLLDGDDARGDGSYAHPYQSWREALRHVGSGDTLIAKNGDYRKAGRAAKWGALDLLLTMADRLSPEEARLRGQGLGRGARPET